MTAVVEVWSWRQAVQRSALKPTTKLVLLNLSIYMNEAGECCYPTTRQQALDTGLSERAVCTHLVLAVEAGLLEKARHGFGGQGWARNEYMARLPDGFQFGKRAERGSARSRGKALNVVPEGTERRDVKALNEVQCNSPLNTPKNSPSGGFSEDGKTSSPFRIDHLLSDMARVRARSAAPGWDIQLLMRVYDENVNSGKMPRPRSADAAFPKWCAAYTKGRPPA